MASQTTDLPFKLGGRTIVIVRNLPVLECGHCAEYSLTDPVMAEVDRLLERIDNRAELEIIRFAA